MKQNIIILDRPIFANIDSEAYYLVYGFEVSDEKKNNRELIISYIEYLIGRQAWVVKGNSITTFTDKKGKHRETWTDTTDHDYRSLYVKEYCTEAAMDFDVSYELVELNKDIEVEVRCGLLLSKDSWKELKDSAKLD